MEKRTIAVNLRREAMAYYQDYNLAQLVEQRLSMHEENYMPETDSTEAKALIEQERPLYYAVIARAIDEMQAIKVTEDEIDELMRSIPFFNYELDYLHQPPAKKLKLRLANKYIDKIVRMFESPGPYTETLTRFIEWRSKLSSPVNQPAELVISGGTSTMESITVELLNIYSDFLETLDISSSDKEKILRNSYGQLINFIHINSLQIIGIIESLKNGIFPPLILEDSRKLEFSVNFLDVALDEEIRGEIVRIFDATAGDAEVIGDLKRDADVIGCPVIFLPGQVKMLWNDVIDEAKLVGMV